MLRRTVLTLPLLCAAEAIVRPVRVIAHRGEHVRHPENTLPAVDGAIEAGADYVELDVRSTKDGALVLMHNANVDERTDGRGAVRDLTLAEIRALDAGVRFSRRFAGTRVPTFDEALARLRGKCGLYLDWKAAPAGALVQSLRRHEMVSRTVVYGPVAGLAELRLLEPELRVMPEALSVEALRHSLAALRPRVVAFDRRDFKDDILRVAIEASVDIFVDRLGPDDTEAAWADAVRRGATGIQTDRPAELRAFLAKR